VGESDAGGEWEGSYERAPCHSKWVGRRDTSAYLCDGMKVVQGVGGFGGVAGGEGVLRVCRERGHRALHMRRRGEGSGEGARWGREAG